MFMREMEKDRWRDFYGDSENFSRLFTDKMMLQHYQASRPLTKTEDCRLAVILELTE